MHASSAIGSDAKKKLDAIEPLVPGELGKTDKDRAATERELTA